MSSDLEISSHSEESDNPIINGVNWCEKYMRNIEWKRKQMRETPGLFIFLRPVE